MGRIGKWFGIENFGVEVDFIVFGKFVGGGLFLGVVVGRIEIM